VSPWERSIEVIVQMLVSMPSGRVGIGMVSLGGLLFAFDGNKLNAIGWLWPNRKVSATIVGVGSFLSAARMWVWFMRG
jgi:hypothetical protein